VVARPSPSEGGENDDDPRLAGAPRAAPGGRLLLFHNRLTGTRCYAQGCGRLLLVHTPRQRNRCLDTPLAIELTERGWLHASGIDPGSVGPASRASA
jgi:hypothetical protein